MMKKIAVLFVMALLLPLQAMAVEKYKEGEHYEVLDHPATAKPEVLEFFSYWCPHCYAFEPLVAQMKQKLDPGTKLNKVHVNFLRFTTKAIQDEATRALMIAKALKQEEKFNNAVFKYIHEQRASVAGLNDLRSLFIVNGVEAADFDKMSKSFGVNSMVKKNAKLMQTYARDLTGVPTFIVNGKYKPTFTNDMSPDDMVDLVVWLSRLQD